MKILIIEDEAPAFRRLQKLLDSIGFAFELLEVLDSVRDATEWLESNPPPDLIFMDIQLNDGISFEIFDRTEVTAPVIFTTAFDEYMLRAFKVNSIDYLLKPINLNDLKASIDKYETMKNTFANSGAEMANLGAIVKEITSGTKPYKSRFLVKTGDKLFAILTQEIAYFETHHGVVYLVTVDNKRHLIDQTLDEIIQLVDPMQFYRCNRQYILNLAIIRVVHRYHKGKLLVETHPAPEEQVLVSAEKATDFKRWFAG